MYSNYFSRKERLVVLILAIVFIIPLFIGVGFFINDLNKVDIAKNGKKVVATVTDFDTVVEINGVPYFYLVYEYTGEDGEIHTGETDSHYTLSEVKDITNILISLGEDGVEVRADYELEFTFPYPLFLAFGIVGIAFWIVTFAQIAGYKKEKKILANGEKRIATFIDMKNTLVTNGVPKFRIKFFYQDSGGVRKEVKTHPIFNFEEAAAYEKAKTFYIKVLNGKWAIIPLDYFSADMPVNEEFSGVNANDSVDFFRENAQDKSENADTVNCPFCGEKVKKADSFCPHCGAGLKGFLD